MEMKKENKQKFVIIRSDKSGVHAGFLKENKENTVVLKDSIRIWYWAGACSLSQLAMEGTKKPTECKFAVPVKEIKVFDVCEIILCTPEAQQNIQNTPSWKT